jgi:hypothetical protein
MTDAPNDEEGGEEAPRPRAGGGEPSEKQLSFITSLQKRIGLSDEELAAVLKDVASVDDVGSLDRRQASEVIDELMTTAKDKGVDLDAQPKASDKQVGFMKSLKRRAHLTDEEFSKFLEERAGVSEPEEVGKRDASKVIDDLLALANSGGAKKGDAGAGGGSKAPPKKAAPKKAAPAAKAPPKKAAAPKKAAPAPSRAMDDDDGPPERGPPPEMDRDQFPEPGEVDDADLERDPGPSDGAPADDDDLPF